MSLVRGWAAGGRAGGGRFTAQSESVARALGLDGSVILQLQRLTNMSADCVIANSLVVAEETFKLEKLPQRKMHVAYNGIDLAKFSRLNELRAQARQMLGVGPDEILVGQHFLLPGGEGHSSVCGCGAYWCWKKSRACVFWRWGWEQYALVVERIRQYGLEDRFHLAGQQTDVLPYLAAMDIGVLSSLGEGFSNSLLEYMASGLPAVATEVGEIAKRWRVRVFWYRRTIRKALADAILELDRQPCDRRWDWRRGSEWNGSVWRGQRSE